MPFRAKQPFNTSVFCAFSEVRKTFDEKGELVKHVVSSDDVPSPSDFRLKTLIAAGAPLQQLDTKFLHSDEFDLGVLDGGHVEEKPNNEDKQNENI